MNIKKILYIVLGTIGLILGAIGAVLPLLPAFQWADMELSEMD